MKPAQLFQVVLLSFAFLVSFYACQSVIKFGLLVWFGMPSDATGFLIAYNLVLLSICAFVFKFAGCIAQFFFSE